MTRRCLACGEEIRVLSGEDYLYWCESCQQLEPETYESEDEEEELTELERREQAAQVRADRNNDETEDS